MLCPTISTTTKGTMAASRATTKEYNTKLRRPKNTPQGWYKSLADGLQEHYNCDYLVVPSCWEQQAAGLSPQDSVSEPEQLPEEQISHSVEEPEQLPEGQYRVDRLVARREKGKAIQYLVLWQGWPHEASEWVDSEDISDTLIDKFDDAARPQENLIREAVAHFTHSIDKSLRVDCHKNTVIRIRFRHDILRFLFKHKNLEQLYSTDFTTEFFPYGWDQWSQQHHEDSGEVGYCGRSIVFPIRIEPYLNWTRPNGFVNMPDMTVRPKQQTFIEMARIIICKKNT